MRMRTYWHSWASSGDWTAWEKEKVRFADSPAYHAFKCLNQHVDAFNRVSTPNRSGLQCIATCNIYPDECGEQLGGKFEK